MEYLDKKIIYYYRNNFPVKKICELTGESYNRIRGRIDILRKKGLLKRWWQE